MTRNKQFWLSASLVTILTIVTVPAFAQSNGQNNSGQQASTEKKASQTGTQGADRGKVTAGRDGEWITLTGSVTESTGEQFMLDYGKGSLAVEMDDFDLSSENALRDKDKVTVTGKIDNDIFESKKIEASSVYVDRLNTYFFADASDEEHSYLSYKLATHASDDEWVGITGTVIEMGDETLTLDTGYSNLKIDTSDVPYDTSASKGDRVSVYGEMDDADLWEGRELLATSVIVLSPS